MKLLCKTLLLCLLLSVIGYSQIASSSGNARRLQGRPICSTAPSNTQVLNWNSGSNCWTPANTGAATISIGGAVASGTPGDILIVGAGPVLSQEATLGAARFPALTGVIATAGGTLTTTFPSSTGSGAVVLATSPTLVTPVLGTPTSGNAANLTNLPLTLTTTGTSGAATYTQGTSTLNIPQYSGGGAALGGINTQTISYTLVTGDTGKTVTFNGSNLTATLPAAPPSATWTVWIANLNATALTIARNGLNINGAAANITLQQGQRVKIETDNTNYFAGVPDAGGNGITLTCGVSVCTWSLNTSVALTIAAEQSGVPQTCESSNGTAAYTCSLAGTGSAVLTVYTADQCFNFTGDTSNPTSVNIDGVAIANFKLADGTTTFPAGLVLANQPFRACYDDVHLTFDLQAINGVPTGTGIPVLQTSPTLITPALGTPASGVLTNETGYLWANLASPPFVSNPQTATYQVLAADFAQCKNIPVASGTFTITLVASGTQPANGQCISVLNYGSGVVTVARSGQNINGAAANLTLAAGSASAPTGLFVWSDGANYFAQPFGAGGSIPGTPLNSLQVNSASTLAGMSFFKFAGTLGGATESLQLYNSTASTGQTQLAIKNGAGTQTGSYPAFMVQRSNSTLGTFSAGNDCAFYNNIVLLDCSELTGSNGTPNVTFDIRGQGQDMRVGSSWEFSWANSAAIGTQDTGIARNAAGLVEVNNGTPGTFAGIKTATYNTGTNCSSSASPAACGSSASGSFVIAASTTSVVVNTTAVTANSQIMVLPDASLGTKLGVTCNTLATITNFDPAITARTGGTSFTVAITGPVVTNPACFSYTIMN
jgi:hypothetical protein